MADPFLRDLWNHYADKLYGYGQSHGANSTANGGTGTVIGGLASDLGKALRYDDYKPSPEAQQLYDNPAPGEVRHNPLDQLGRSFLDIDTGVAKSLANTVAKGYGAMAGKDYVPFPKPFSGADPQSIRALSHAADAARYVAGTPVFKLPAMGYDYLREAAGGVGNAIGGPELGGAAYGLMTAMPQVAGFAEGGEVGEIGSAIGDAVSGAVKDAVGAPEAAAAGSNALPLIGLAPEHAQSFSDALSAAKAANPWGDQVYQYPTEDYSAMKMFMTPDRKAGYAIKPDGDIVSVFKHPDSPEKGFGVRALNHAVQNGGTKLDAFDTELPKIYAKAGFQEYARTPWDDAFAPPNWDYQKYGQFNGGRPDVVYMVHPQAGLARYTAEADPAVLQYSQRTGKTELPTVYHGTASPEDFKGFGIRDNSYYGQHSSGYNGFVAEDPRFASEFARNGIGGGETNMGALAATGHVGDPADSRVLPMRFGPRKLYDPLSPEGQQVAVDWFSSPKGRELYDTSPLLRDRLLGDYYRAPGSMITPEQRQAYVDQNLFADQVANPHSNWVPMEVPEWVNHLRSLGYDAAALREAGARNYGLLDSGAVKSSVGNVGTYDRSNPDLLKADGGQTKPVSAFRQAYPAANPAYGTKPLNVGDMHFNVSADPDAYARAMAAIQRMNQQAQDDSARRADGNSVSSAAYAALGKGTPPGQQPAKFASGGPVGRIGDAFGSISEAIDQSVVDALRAGKPAPQLAERYPARVPGVWTKDKGTGKIYVAKVNSPEATALNAFRNSAQKDINAGNYQPYFDVSQRSNVDPSLFPTSFNSLDIRPAKAPTIAKYREHAMGPQALQTLSSAFEKQMTDSENWYYMKQLMDEYVNKYGPEVGQAAFQKNFANAMAATTGGSDPTSNFLMAHYGNYLRNQGQPMPEAAYEMASPIGGRYASGNAETYNKFINGDQQFGVDTPKRGNFAYNFLGHGDRSTIDEQMMGGMGQTPWLVSGKNKILTAPPDNTYGIYEEPVHELAQKYGVDPRGFQDVTWAGLKDTKGMPMIDHVNQSIERTSRVTGLPQDEVVSRYLEGSIPMYSTGGSA